MIRAIRTDDCDAVAALEAETFNTALDQGRLLNFMTMRAFAALSMTQISQTL